MESIHALCAALHTERCDPAQVEILLPFDQWWRLYSAIERRNQGLTVFDGRGGVPQQFRYMGITFKAKPVSRVEIAA